MDQVKINSNAEIKDAASLLHPITYSVSFEVNCCHRHSCWEITLLLRGSAKTYINDTVYYVNRGDLFISKPGDYHYFKVEDKKNYEHRDLYLDDKDMRSVCNALSPNLYQKLSDPVAKVPIIHIGEELATILDRKLRFLQLSTPEQITENDRVIQKSIVAFILGTLFESERYPTYPPWLVQVLTEMNSYKIICGPLDNIISLTDFSHEHLTREFKKYLGISPIEYLIKQKMDYAALLLRQTDKNILEIATEIGYNSLSYFTTQFKKIFHVSPGQYRKKLREPTEIY